MSRFGIGSHWTLSLALVAGSLVFGYFPQPLVPEWTRVLALAVLQGALGAAASMGSQIAALRRIALKTALWPPLAIGLAGAARLAGVEVYNHLEWIALISLALAHVLGEAIVAECGARSGECGVTDNEDGRGPALTPHPALRTPHSNGWVAWFADARWLLAIAGVPWCWDLVAAPRLALFLAAGAVFVWLVRPSRPGLRSRGTARRACRSVR